MGKGSVRGLSLWKWASGVGADDMEPERGCGKVAQGVHGVDWTV